MNVFITVDTEVSTYGHRWQPARLAGDMRQDIYGATPTGEFGIPYQIDVLNAHGLKGVFFVEALFGSVVGHEPLREIVRLVQDGGHEVQLHVHPEWLANMPDSVLPGRTGENLTDFTEEEQSHLIGRGLRNLHACGVEEICAFRAGTYGADFATLRALPRHGIRYDTSYNACYLDSTCALRTERLIIHPQQVEGIWELPIALFQDYPGHHRPAQVCACSHREMQYALLAAWKRGWSSFVIVSHSFELIRRPRSAGEHAVADPMVIRRFEKLCRFLAQHRDKFRTATFADLTPAALQTAAPSEPLPGSLPYTALRMAEQASRRLVVRPQPEPVGRTMDPHTHSA